MVRYSNAGLLCEVSVHATEPYGMWLASALQEMVIWSSVRQEMYLHVYVHNLGLYHMSGFYRLSVGNVSVLRNGSMKRCEILSFLLHHRLSIIMRI